MIKFIWVLLYFVAAFIDYGAQGSLFIESLIEADLSEKATGNTIYQYMKNKGGNPLVLLRKEKALGVYNTLPDEIKVSVEKINIIEKMDLDGDGYCEEEWTINPDGTESRTTITPTKCR